MSIEVVLAVSQPTSAIDTYDITLGQQVALRYMLSRDPGATWAQESAQDRSGHRARKPRMMTKSYATGRNGKAC